jgi:phenylacetate-CoA ligase
VTDLPPRAAPYFDEEYETMPRPQLEALQLERLRETVALAYERSPLVRARWQAARVTPEDVRSVDDFREKVPFIDKESLRRFRDERGDPYGGILCVPPNELTAVMSTSGTTGDPTLVPEQWGGQRRRTILFRDLWGMGVRPGDYFALFLFTFRGPTYAAVQGLGATPVLLDYDVGELERLLDVSHRYRPTGLYNLGGTMIKALAEVAERDDVDMVDAFSSYKGVVSAGEPLGDRARALAAAWEVELFEHSGVGDVTGCFECGQHDGLHFWEDDVLVEGLDIDGDSCELVATALSNRVAPLVRYRSGDLVRVTWDRCACGRTHGRLWPRGRRSDEVEVEGRAVLPIDVWSAVESVEACRLGLFQIVRPRRQVDRLRVRVGHAPVPRRALEALRDDVARAVADAVGIVPQIELVPNETLLRLGPPHKIPRVTRT